MSTASKAPTASPDGRWRSKQRGAAPPSMHDKGAPLKGGGPVSASAFFALSKEDPTSTSLTGKFKSQKGAKRASKSNGKGAPNLTKFMGAKYYRTAGNETNAVLEFTGTKKMAQFRYRPASSELQLLRDMSFVEKTKQYPASHFAAKWPASSHPCLVYDV